MNQVKEALKAAITALEYHHLYIKQDKHAHKLCKAALSDIEKCEPVAQAIRERDRLGFAVVGVMTKLDEIIENTQEVEIDDFLHIAVPIDMWNELEAALEDMPKRADLYTSPQPRDWVEIDRNEVIKMICTMPPDASAKAINDTLKQLNTKG